MAFTSILESHQGMEAGGSGRGAKLKRTATRVFTVTTDAATSPVWSFPLTVGGVTIPAAGTPHPDYSFMLSSVARVAAAGSPMFFTVTVPYETPDPADPDDAYEDPLAAPAEIAWDTASREVPYDVDLAGSATTNSAGQPFDPALTRSARDARLVIERNQAAFDPDDLLTYVDTVCSDATFWGADGTKCRMEGLSARSVYAETPYWRARYEVIFRMKVPAGTPAGKEWWRCVADKATRYVDGNGYWRDTPDGKEVYINADGTPASPSSPHWLYFKEFDEQSWAALALEPT
jgi:hypothetical protein